MTVVHCANKPSSVIQHDHCLHWKHIGILAETYNLFTAVTKPAFLICYIKLIVLFLKKRNVNILWICAEHEKIKNVKCNELNKASASHVKHKLHDAGIEVVWAAMQQHTLHPVSQLAHKS